MVETIRASSNDCSYTPPSCMGRSMASAWPSPGTTLCAAAAGRATLTAAHNPACAPPQRPLSRHPLSTRAAVKQQQNGGTSCAVREEEDGGGLALQLAKVRLAATLDLSCLCTRFMQTLRGPEGCAHAAWPCSFCSTRRISPLSSLS
jgi:hypothetical protein